ncbi:MAG: hypothetical protein AAGH70_00840 [Pseudomonadota bacterium]
MPFPKVLCLLVALLFLPLSASAEVNVLWWNATVPEPPNSTDRHRKEMADFLDSYQGGSTFQVTFQTGRRRGRLSQAMASGSYDIIILDVTDRVLHLNASDTESLKRHYSSGKNALMLDGSFAIRNMQRWSQTRFPGPGGAMAGLLVNQMVILSEAGGGILIGVDHDQWQRNGNYVLDAILPGAKFRGSTNPSTDGEFIGDALLGRREAVTARDVLRHWETVPNQGEAPVGTFTDFMGQQVQLFSLVETADKPGGGRKRPYISASIYPGEGKTDIDSDEPAFQNLPTHKSGTN